MDNENEMVEQIAKKMRNNPLCWLSPEGIPQMHHDNDELSDYADRILSAHKRELAAKDDERLTIVANYENIIAAKDAEIAKRDALINELADALEKLESIGVDCACCGIPCDRNDGSKGCIVDELGALVAKAREVVK